MVLAALHPRLCPALSRGSLQEDPKQHHSLEGDKQKGTEQGALTLWGWQAPFSFHLLPP